MPVAQLIQQWWYIPGFTIAILLLLGFFLVSCIRHRATLGRRAETQENLERWDDKECAHRVKTVLNNQTEFVAIRPPAGALLSNLGSARSPAPALPPRPVMIAPTLPPRPAMTESGLDAYVAAMAWEYCGRKKREVDVWEDKLGGNAEAGLPAYEPGDYGMLYRSEAKGKEPPGGGNEEKSPVTQPALAISKPLHSAASPPMPTTISRPYSTRDVVRKREAPIPPANTNPFAPSSSGSSGSSSSQNVQSGEGQSADDVWGKRLF